MNSINDKIKNGKMLETIFNNTHFLIAYLDNDFNFIKVNRAYAEKHNKDTDFFVGKNHFELYPQGNESIFKKVIETGEPYFAYSKPLDHPVLGISYWDWAIQPVKNENGEFDTLILSLTDVTEYKRSENEIQKEHDEFIDKLIEEHAAEFLSKNEEIESEKKRESMELNQRIHELEKANEILKKELESQNAEEDDDFHIEAFDKQINELKKANKSFKEIINAQNPKIEELYQQVVELKKTKKVSEETLSSNLFKIKDLNQRISELETEVSEKEEIISKKELEIEKLNQEIIELEKNDVESSKLIITKNSEIENINKSIDALQNALRNSKKTISVKEEDIKKLKILKEDSSEIISAKMHEIQELNEKISDQQKLINEITRRNETLKSELENSINDDELLRQLDELIKSNEELEKFTEIAANELQEPLRAIKSFTNVLAKRYRGKIDKDADEFIDYTLEAVNRLNKKIIGLLEYSRIESRGKEFKLTETEEILDYAVSNLNASIDENNATITHGDLPQIMADSGQILLLFQNLLNNAVKFKNPKINPKIHISAYLDEKNNEYVFSIRDNGIGIEEKDLEKVFNIFKQLQPKNGHQGIGIGLSISKKIVERHGGRIWAESEPELGSEFFFTISPTENLKFTTKSKELEILDK